MSTNKNKLTPTQSRAARRARRQNRSRLTRWGIGLAVAIVALLLIIGLILPMAGNLGGSRTSSAPEGPGKRIEDQGRDHVEENSDHPPYNSIPATSGWHYTQPLAPVSWGVHGIFIPEEKRIHNLEHGGISITYNCQNDCPQLIKDLTAVVQRARAENMKVLLSPYPNTESRISLTAWTFMDAFNTFDEKRIIEFIESHHNSPNAPEPFAN